MNTPKNFLFDLGGVIFHLNYQKTYKAFEKILGLNQQHFFNQLHQPPFFDQHERGEISNEEFFKNFSSFNSQLTTSQISDAWNAMLVGIPMENIEFLEDLASNSSLFLLSNTNAIHWKKVEFLLQQAKQRDRFYACFKKVFLSYEIGMRKPEERIYLHCLEKLKLTANDIIFIDDNIHNIAQAKKCGIRSIHYPSGNPLLGSTLPNLL